ncbi:hypothetical protein [Streptacidiphilus jiangxiensis]|uniref:Uncharacterized protein n=1 Tax=Streptacidiphilus jiangxiensis TaxID=235985 RepID=A0A1H7TPT7_STRJI|nr:hypothetical protein [Streptacidiphilus jiangxiensis]SEL86575.1 hypothetical protein SAMN05414137_114120 [Streptacidiphilus jiangxiensis]
MHVDDRIGEGVSAELAEFLRGAVDDRPAKIAPAVCDGCGGRWFSVLVDGMEGAAERECPGCGRRAFIADSEEFEDAVAFLLAEDGPVRWVTLGLRCQHDGAVESCADWKIDYGPTDHLLGRA